jgi:epoxyqueuosine reductase QueG
MWYDGIAVCLPLIPEEALPVKRLVDLLMARGAALVGFADLSALDEPARRGFPRAVAIGMALSPAVVAGIRTGPTEEYCIEYDRTNDLLTAMAKEGAELLDSLGCRAEARPATHDWDRATFRAPFSHKVAATLSGLGWIGKCNLLVTPRYGSAVRWATVLTDAPLETGKPITESRCGQCRTCAGACPGQACSGRNWRQGMEREDLWDHRACLRGMEAIAAGRGNRHGICGLCIAVCPLTQAYLRRAGAV